MADKKKKKKDEEEEEEKKGGKAKMIVGGVLALGAVYNFVLKPAPVVEDPLAMVDIELVEGEIYQMEELVLNLDDPDVGYLRVGIAVVLEEGVLSDDFELEVAIARDVAIGFLSAQEAGDLRSPAGKVEIKEELSMLMREAYEDSTVVRVLFTGLVMQ